MDRRYEQLEMEGKLLEGDDLDFAFDSISAFSDNGENQEYTFLSEESLEDIRDSKLALRAEVSDLEKQLASLEWKLDLLTAQATTITQGKKSRSSAKTRANGQLTGLDEKFAKRNLEVMFLAFVKLQNQYTTYTTMLPVLYSNSIISLFHLYYVLVSGFRTCHLAPSLLWMKAIWYI